MIHTLNMQCEWSSDKPRTHNALYTSFMEEGLRHFKPDNTESVEVQLTTQGSKPPLGDRINFTTYANITYDTAKDRYVSKTITGGRSIPVPAH